MLQSHTTAAPWRYALFFTLPFQALSRLKASPGVALFPLTLDHPASFLYLSTISLT
jgi:hypothetical protein